jgi:hypothetical protein
MSLAYSSCLSCTRPDDALINQSTRILYLWMKCMLGLAENSVFFSSTELYRAACMPWNCQPSVYLLFGICLCRQPLAFRMEQSLVPALLGFVYGEQLWWISGVYILALWLGLNLYKKPSNWLHFVNLICVWPCIFNVGNVIKSRPTRWDK